MKNSNKWEAKWGKEKDKLSKLIHEEKLSYEEIGRLYNCSGANIKKVARRLEINIGKRRKINPNETFGKGIHRTLEKECKFCGKKYRKSRKHRNDRFCSNNCRLNYFHKEKYQKLIDGDPEIMRATYNPNAFKKDILDEQGGVCAICGQSSEWNGKPLTFVLDHIDGHASNNRRDNLRCICPNCDSQLDTYKSKNKKSDRNYRYSTTFKDDNDKPLKSL